MFSPLPYQAPGLLAVNIFLCHNIHYWALFMLLKLYFLKILYGILYIRKEFIFSITGFLIFLLLTASVSDEDKIPVCDKLDDKVSSEMMKYSVNADVDGPVYFGDIACAVKFRTKDSSAPWKCSALTQQPRYMILTRQPS